MKFINNVNREYLSVKPHAIIARVWVILTAIILIAITVFVWQATRASTLSYISQNTSSKANYYSTEIELRKNRIEFALKELAFRSDYRLDKLDTEWNEQANFYIQNYAGIDSIIWVDKDFVIKKIASASSTDFSTDQSVKDASPGLEYLFLFQPIYKERELIGFIFSELNIPKLVLSVTEEAQDEYQTQIYNEQSLIYSSEDWESSKERFAKRVQFDLNSPDSWELLLKPTDKYINSNTLLANVVLFFGFILSLGIAVVVWIAQNLDQKSKLLLQTQDELIASQTELIASNQELESFSYSVSHDLRAPLRHVHGFVELLKSHLQGTLDDKSQHYIEVISEATDDMGRLIDSLLSYSRMGKTQIDKTKVDLNEVVSETISAFQPELQTRNIEWTIAKLPPVYGDITMISLLFNNLISNALKFTREETTAMIEIGSKPDPEKSNHIIIYVKDNGAGFDMQYTEKLFGVFQRLHSQKEYEGTGIGLANVKRMTQRHGGRVWAEGALGEGAAFYFTLPKYQE